MKNTNKPQWLLDAEKDINEFHETKPAKFSKKQLSSINNLDNVDREKLVKVLKDSGKLDKWRQSGASAGGKVNGKKNVESGHLKSIASAGGKAAGNLTKQNGTGIFSQTAEERSINSKKGSVARLKNMLITKNKKQQIFLDLLPEIGITRDIAEDAVVVVGYAKRQASRFCEELLEIDNLVIHVDGKSRGRTNWKLTTYKKK